MTASLVQRFNDAVFDVLHGDGDRGVDVLRDLADCYPPAPMRSVLRRLESSEAAEFRQSASDTSVAIRPSPTTGPTSFVEGKIFVAISSS